MSPVYLRLKPERQETHLIKYIVYGHTEDKITKNIHFWKIPHIYRSLNSDAYDIITEEEFKLEAL